MSQGMQESIFCHMILSTGKSEKDWFTVASTMLFVFIGAIAVCLDSSALKMECRTSDSKPSWRLVGRTSSIPMQEGVHIFLERILIEEQRERP